MVSIIVLVHNNVALSLRCLEALSGAVTGLDHEVLLLDNASTECTDDLRECGGLFRRFQLIRREENLPFSRVNNDCAALASGRWLLFLNNDVFVDRDGVKRLLDLLRAVGSIGIAGGKLLFPGGAAVQHAGICQTLWGYPSNYGVGAGPSDARVDVACDRFALTGAMMCLPREVFRKVRGFDERYIWGYEDVDICLKIRASGLRVAYDPTAAGIHEESATLKVTRNGSPSNNYRIYREVWDGMLIPLEQDYMRKLSSQGIRRVVIFGTGLAARGLAGILLRHGIQVAAFTSTRTQGEGEEYLDRPVLPLASLPNHRFDRLVVGSQFYFEVEPLIREFDPLNDPVFPVFV